MHNYNNDPPRPTFKPSLALAELMNAGQELLSRTRVIGRMLDRQIRRKVRRTRPPEPPSQTPTRGA